MTEQVGEASIALLPLTGVEARRAARNAGALAIARILSSGALFIWQILLARLLGEAQFGIYSTIGPLYTIAATAASFSIGVIVIREVARKPENAGKYLSVTLLIQTLFAMIAYIGLNLAGLALGYSPELRALAAIAAISLFLDLTGSMAYDQLIAQEKMVGASVIEIAHMLIRIALALLLVSAGFGLMGVYIATLITGIGRLMVLWWLMLRTGVHPSWPANWGIGIPLLLAAAPLALSAVINSAYTHLDRLVSTSVLTEQDTAHINAAFVIVTGTVEILNTTILVALFPLMARLYKPGGTRGENESFYFLVQKLAYFALLIGLPVALTATVFSAEVAVPIFGENFRPTADVLRIMIWYAALTMIANVFAQALMSANQQGRYVVVRAVGLVVKLALAIFLLPRVGVVGAALSSVVAEAGVMLALGWMVPLNWRARLRQFARLALVCAASLLALLALGAILPVLGMIGGVLVYAAGVLFAGALAGDDYDLLYRIVAAFPGGAQVRKYWKRDVKLTWE
ncbi:MAG: oligosaccharide flippase family protein [Anaerolineae bacterium]|nr:oligosaccharide flippase family protein [Anaerolineae bacterium]